MENGNVANQSQKLNLGLQFFAEDAAPAAGADQSIAGAAEAGNLTEGLTTPQQGQVQQPAQQTVTQPTEPEKFTVKHNKETVEMTLDELQEAASKGLDYDRVRPGYDFVKHLAEQNGTPDVNQYIGTIQQRMTQEQHNQNVQAYADAGFAPEVAEKMAKNDEQIATISNRLTEQDRQQQEAQKTNALWNQIREEYPDTIKGDKVNFPEGAVKLLSSGKAKSPLEALRLNHINELKAQLDGYKSKESAQQANTAGAAATVGSLSGGQAQEKDFYTSEEYNNLPEQAKDKLFKSGKIFELMRKWERK